MPAPKFINDSFQLLENFPRFLNVYQVSLTAKGKQYFLKCDCELYTRCGIPCSHVFKVTDEVTKEMLANQHWKDYPVHYGVENSILSMSLMKKVTWQKEHENYGTPITESTLEQCHRMFKLLSVTKTKANFPIL